MGYNKGVDTNWSKRGGTIYRSIGKEGICLSHKEKVSFWDELLKQKVRQSGKSMQKSGNIKTSKQGEKKPRNRPLCSVCGIDIHTFKRSGADAFYGQVSRAIVYPGKKLNPFDSSRLSDSLYDAFICERCRRIYCLNCLDPLKNFPDINLFCPNCATWSLRQLSRELLY